MKRPEIFARWFCVAGFSIALLLTALAYMLNALHVRYDLDALYSILFPFSLGYMAIDPLDGRHVSIGTQIFAVLMLSAMNGGLYWLVGFIVGIATTPLRKG